MRLIDKIFAVILGLVTASACVVLLLIVLEVVPHEHINNFLYNVRILWPVKLVICIGSIIILAVSIRLIIMAPRKEYSHHTPQYINITPDGNVKITSEAVNDVASRTAKELAGVMESQSSIRLDEKGLSIKMKLITTSDVNIPELAASVQNNVKQTLEDFCGLSPTNVQVLIEKNQTPQQRTIK